MGRWRGWRVAALSLWAAGAVAETGTITSELIATTLVEDGQPVRLQLVIHKPGGGGPFPTVIFNHGSTGTGEKPRLFRRDSTQPTASEYFVREGWMVITPHRRGRGDSGGRYDEGFEPDHSRYSCEPRYSLPGVDRAVEDLDQVMAHVRARPDVRADQIILSGQSRGGVLAVAYAGLRPQWFRGVVNFVGFWVGRECPASREINDAIVRRGGAFPHPMLWLYAERDHYASPEDIRAMFAGFSAAGGQGELVTYPLPGHSTGHRLILLPKYWAATVHDYLLDTVGVKSPAAIPKRRRR